MKLAAGVLLVLSLGSCTQETSTAERAEIADVNARNALAKIEELESRVDNLEQRLGVQER